MAQKKKLKVPKIKGIKNGKKPTKPSPALIRKILRGPLFWIVAALITVSIFGQISTTVVTLGFTVAPASGAYTVVIVG